MRLRKKFAMLNKELVVVLLAVLVCGGGAWMVSKVSTPEYKAQAGLYFSLNASKSATDLNQGSTYTQNQMVSFAQLATSPIVLDPVMSDLGLSADRSKLANSLTVATPLNSVILQVGVTYPSAQKSADIANSVANYLSRAVEQLSPIDADGKPTITVRTIENANVPTAPSSPNTGLNIIIGLILGLILGLLLLVGSRRLDWRVRTATDVGTGTDLPLLGSVVRDPQPDDGAALFIRASSGPDAEDFRRLRERLRFEMTADESLCVLLTPSSAGGDDSAVAQNLGCAFAETGVNVLLLDADLRKQARTTDAPLGLSDLLTDGSHSLGDVIRPTELPGLDLLPAGTTYKNPSQLVSSAAMADLVATLKGKYDVVIINSAPASNFADALVLASITGRVVLTVEPGTSHRSELRQTSTLLESSGGRILGVLLTKARGRSKYQRRTSGHVRVAAHGSE